MTKTELIEKLKTRIWFAEQDLTIAVDDTDKDIAITKKIITSQILELVEQLDDTPELLE